MRSPCVRLGGLFLRLAKREAKSGHLAVEQMLQLQWFFRRLAKRHRDFKKDSGDLTGSLVLTKIGDRFHSNETLLGPVLQLNRNGDGALVGQRASRLRFVESHR